MNPSHKPRMRALLVGLPLVGLRFAVPASDNARPLALPKDPCALLKPAEIQAALAPGTTIGPGVAAENMLPLGVECTYTWGPRTREWGESAQLTDSAHPAVSLDRVPQFVGVEDTQRQHGVECGERPLTVQKPAQVARRAKGTRHPYPEHLSDIL